MEKFGTKFSNTFQIKVISSLLGDRVFTRQVFDILKPQYFDSEASEWLVKEIMSYMDTYETLPTLDVLKVKINSVERDVLKTSIVDRIVPVSVFEAQKAGNNTPTVSINITGLTSPLVSTTDSEVIDV